jgi:hypothetical protein
MGRSRKSESVKDRFEDKIFYSPDGCWYWTGSTNGKGYGNFQLDGKLIGSHKASYILYKGGINDGLLVCHTCDVPLCVNPHHLFLGTNKDNAQDKAKKGRSHKMKGEDHPLSKLSTKDILEIRSLYKNGVKSKELAKRYNTRMDHITDICRKKIWKHI